MLFIIHHLYLKTKNDIIYKVYKKGEYMSDSHSLVEGSLWKKILLFSLPLMLSNLLQVLFNMADVAVVGKFSGSQALGAVGSTSIMVTLFTGILIGMGSGVNVIVARYIGENEQNKLRKTVFSALIACICVGAFLLAFGEIFIEFLLRLVKTKDTFIADSTLYMRIYLLGMPALGIYNFGNGTFSADGDTRKPLFILMIAGVLNVILNLFFVIVCKIDVAGVAIASIISQYVSAILIVILLVKSKRQVKMQFSIIDFDKNRFIEIMKLGIPSGLQNAIFSVANLFIQAGVNSFDDIMVEGNSAAINSDALVYDVMAAFYMACSSFIGQNFGARKKKRVLQSYFISLIYSVAIAMILGLLLVAFGKEFLSLFTSEEEVILAGMKRLRILALSYWISGFMDCTIAASRGLGKSLVPTIIVICGSCIFRVIWVYTIFAHYKTIPSLYLLYAFSWAITSIFEIGYFIHCYKQKVNTIEFSNMFD